MNDLQDIIDFKLHPIDDWNYYVGRCREKRDKRIQ